MDRDLTFDETPLLKSWHTFIDGLPIASEESKPVHLVHENVSRLETMTHYQDYEEWIIHIRRTMGQLDHDTKKINLP